MTASWRRGSVAARCAWIFPIPAPTVAPHAQDAALPAPVQVDQLLFQAIRESVDRILLDAVFDLLRIGDEAGQKGLRRDGDPILDLAILSHPTRVTPPGFSRRSGLSKRRSVAKPSVCEARNNPIKNFQRKNSFVGSTDNRNPAFPKAWGGVA